MKNIWEVELMGILAADEFVQEKAGKPRSVFKNSQNSIQFLIKVVSDTPEGFPHIRLFNCYTSDLIRFGFEDDITLSEPERIRLLREYLNERLIIFRPNRKYKEDRSTVYQAKDVNIVNREDSYREQTFKPVPVFSQKVHELNYEDFMEMLIKRKHVGRIDNISHELNDTPEIILWRHIDGEFTIIGIVSGHNYAHGGFNFSFKDNIKEVKFEDVWLEDAYSSSDTILYIGIDTYNEILGHLETVSPADLGSIDDIQELEQEQELAIETEIQPLDVSTHINNQEFNFLERFLNVTRDMKLSYEKKDLYNFHTAMKSSTLVILAGMSGTGKSKLVESYVRALNLDPNDQLTIIPVRPAWSDDADILGYVDSIHSIYRPGDSGLINTLVAAQNNSDRLFIVCFDEMNLARVEHYFSQFLSVLEMEPSRRNLTVYNEELEARLYNSARYPSSIRIGDNVIFVGTVNLDESTYHFSDKVLDRANIIKLKVKPFNELYKLGELNSESTDEKKKKPIEDFKRITNEEFRSFKEKDTSFSLNEDEQTFLWKIHEDLQAVNNNLGIGPRIVKQIDMYLKNLPKDKFLSRMDAFDLQLVQRILSKLRGPEDQFKSLIGTINIETGKIEKSKFLERFDQYNTVSTFSESIKVIEQKAKELKINGYTL